MRASYTYLALVLLSLVASPALAQYPVVPGNGVLIWMDDMEDPDWTYVPNNPKSSQEQDKQVRLPGGISKNKLWGESAKRGHPDYLHRVETPAGGIPGSTGSLVMQTLNSMVPGRSSFTLGQDDLICRVPGSYSVASYPNCVVRVYLPPFEKWEQRSAPASLGFRTTVIGTRTERKGSGIFASNKQDTTESWPGIFIEYRCAKDANVEEDEAQWIIRGAAHGDIKGPKVTELGWWTIGMSFTPDGRCHYYIGPGVEDLTEDNLIGSHHPYNYKIKSVSGMFFNIFNFDNGKSWSTPWVVDDPAFYLGRGQVAERQRGR
ncbi:MAG: hypothetical protein WDZ51_12975 [Pirellulaceae bacterium]